MHHVRCPRCRSDQIVSFVRREMRLARYGEQLGGAEAIPLPKGQTHGQIRCDGCGAHWGRPRDFEQEWVAAGRPDVTSGP